jgi:hypothetical protein
VTGPTAGIVAAVGVAGAAVLRSRRRARAGAVGWVGERLRHWQPGPPRTPAARVAAVIWAAPVSVAGLLVGAGAVVRPRVEGGVLVFAPARGVSGAIIRRRGFAATGLGHVVVALGEPSPALLAHELLHVRQAERLGVLFLPTYVVLLVVHGYHRHPLEHAARVAAARTTGGVA